GVPLLFAALNKLTNLLRALKCAMKLNRLPHRLSLVRRHDALWLVARPLLQHARAAGSSCASTDHEGLPCQRSEIVTTSLADVCFTSERDQTAEIARGPSRATTRLMQCSKHNV